MDLFFFFALKKIILKYFIWEEKLKMKEVEQKYKVYWNKQTDIIKRS